MKQDVSTGWSLSSRWVARLRVRIAGMVTAGLVLTLLLSTTAAHAGHPVAPVASVPVASAAPADEAHGTVIVQLGDHELVARPITFTAPISGLAALQLSGLEVVAASTSYGTVVCSIEGVGCPADNCFCDDSVFWGYKSWDGAVWQDYMVGASESSLGDGAVEGWRWGEWGSAMWPAQPVTAALRALDWLIGQQSLADGGYGGDGGSAEVLMAIGANGYGAGAWRLQAGSPSLSHYWLAHARSYSGQGAAQAGKLAVGAVAGKMCWPRSAVQPGDYYDETTGIYAEGSGPQAWAILGEVSLDQAVPAEAIAYLKGLAQPGSGFEWGPGWGADTNATALALQALIATGEPISSPVVMEGLAYLRGVQNEDGGFPYQPDSPWGTDSDANSTAYVIETLRAAGEDPNGVAWSKGDKTPISFLLSLQLNDGSFEWQEGQGSNPLATEQAVVALLGRTFPLRTAETAWCPAVHLPITVR